MKFSKDVFPSLRYLLIFTVAYSPIINAGTIYLYLENKTDQIIRTDPSTPTRQDDPGYPKGSSAKDIIKPHTKEIIGEISGTPTKYVGRSILERVEGITSYVTVGILLPKSSKKVYFKAASRATGTEGEFPSGTSVFNLFDTLKRVGLNWDISFNDSDLEVGTTENIPGSKKIFTVGQNKDCGKSCKKYRITATKKTYPVRAPDINFVVEEI